MQPPSSNPPNVRHRGPPPQRPARPAAPRPPPPRPEAAPAGYNNATPAPAPSQYYAGQSTAATATNDWYTPSAADATMDYSMTAAPAVAVPSNYAMPAPAPYSTSFPTHPYPTNPSYFGGTMDTAAASTPYSSTPSTFVPAAPQADLQGYDTFENEPPLLEELGVNWEHILMKTKAVVIPFRRFQQHSALTDPSIICGDADLAGPLVYALLLGGELLVTGKLQFGSIYGFGLFGCLSMTLILNLMSATAISFWTVTSILGYALIPVNLLAALKIVFFSFGTLVRIFALITVIWSTTASTRLLEIGFGLADQRYLLAYPIALLYSAFVLITIF
jgi:protein YIPF5/7